jgi:outer membrane phospholipase A
MGTPRLENRTGRFASSVRVTDVMPTKQGFPSIGYTYQRDPYQVYESTSGSRFASTNRDPRSLIDGSIREIAAELAIGRLYTRRV